MEKKRIVILGSTGSIGRQTLQVVRSLKDSIEVIGLAARSNVELLLEQAAEFNVPSIAIYEKDGIQGLVDLVTDERANLIVCAMTGTLGLIPTIRAIQCGKSIALANKEILVSAGFLITNLAKKHKIELFPIDSEHSALFQCLNGEDPKSVKKMIVTASGGPFRGKQKKDLEDVKVKEALSHPTWSMGIKNTIDSATLMNKGLEVIEAHWLFNLPLDKISVVVHPQSVVHGMVEFEDGSVMAQLSKPSMLLPIQYALTYPVRTKGVIEPLDLIKLGRLDFEAPDINTFVCLRLALEAIEKGGTLPCYMNAANEVLVDRFVKGNLDFLQIGEKLEQLMLGHRVSAGDCLEEIFEVDAMAREQARKV